MPAAFPSWVRPMLRMSKQRSQPAAFALAEPRRGFGYAREIGTDQPVFWACQFRFTRAEAVVFRLWFVYTINAGVDEFTMPILTEFGLIDHTCRFLPDGLLNMSEDGEVVTYSATIMARAEVIPDDYAEAAYLIAGMPDWTSWAEYLDQAMTAEMPT